jgi:hypothetical protein
MLPFSAARNRKFFALVEDTGLLEPPYIFGEEFKTAHDAIKVALERLDVMKKNGWRGSVTVYQVQVRDYWTRHREEWRAVSQPEIERAASADHLEGDDRNVYVMRRLAGQFDSAVRAGYEPTRRW